MQISDGAIIPANVAIDAAERQRRIDLFHGHYHAAVDEVLDAALASGKVPVILSVHSFTPVWKGSLRPWHAGVLWDADPRLAMPLVAALRAEKDLVVGDNDPYSGALTDDTMYRHATSRGLAHALIEIRQDLIGDEAGALAWAERLAAILTELNVQPEMHEVRHFGSRKRPRFPVAHT
jgi:predicted N-formylglutamate amidohydrolase